MHSRPFAHAEAAKLRDLLPLTVEQRLAAAYGLATSTRRTNSRPIG
jgi:hypothetical protein